MADYESSLLGFMPAFSSSPEQAVMFTVHGEPTSKQRPRFTKGGRTYTPKQTTDAEALIRSRYLEASGGLVFTTHVGLELQFYMGTKRRKDTDNLIKTVLDALNKVAFEDDYLVHVLSAVKFYSTPGKARTVIRLYAVDGPMVEAD